MRMVGRTAVAMSVFALTMSGAAVAAPTASSPDAKPIKKAVEVVKQPLNDLNIVKPEIAPVLVRAKAAPYAPAGGDCHGLDAEIQELDLALGPDFDAPHAKETSLSKRLTDGSFSLARGAVSSLIPYRGIVRQVTGAEKRAQDVNDALLAGMVRRGYLKGYGEMLGCRFSLSSPEVNENAPIVAENPQD